MPNDILREEFRMDSIMGKIDKIRSEIDKCNMNPTKDNLRKKDELVWAQFMAGLKLSSGNLFF